MITDIKSFKRTKRFLVCIDSDGCVFDTMEIKHKECFCPTTIEYWGLQAISRFAREAWEYVNLYSKSRGCSRFHAIVQVLDLLSQRKEVQHRGFAMPEYTSLKHWVETAPVLNNAALSKLTADPVLKRTLDWSLEINRRVAQMVKNIPPFPLVRESLETFHPHADIVITSATPREALMAEWREHGLDRYVALLGSQENGSKKEIIAGVMEDYAPENCLMIGDAPGDQKAAMDSGIHFYPIVPGHEEDSWESLHHKVLKPFLNGDYTDSLRAPYLLAFDKSLPSSPPWNEA